MMNTKEELLNILGQNFDKLPLKYDVDLKQLLEESFEKLKTKIKTSKIERVIDITADILGYIEKYKNKDTDAEDYFNNIMNKIVPDLEFVSEMYDKISSNIYYRARISEKDLADRSDIFHLPYDANKSLERSYRYSMKNQHFLYLGATIYTCYQECGEPNVDNFYVAAFDIPQNYRILRLAILPYEIKSFIEKDNFKLSDDNYKKLLLSYINILPLIMACSVKKKNNQAVEEYIVPQAVMNWVVNGKKWNGIEYFSNVVLTYSRKNYKLYRNLVLISKNDSIGERFCKKLSKEIKFTKPLRINGLNLFKEYTDNEEIKPILEQENITVPSDYVHFDSDINRDFSKELGCVSKTENESIHYSSSGFYLFEYILSKNEKNLL